MLEHNETVARQLEHRTIREFTNDPVPKETLDTILAVANRTATSTGLQSYSIVRVTDGDVRGRIAEVCRQEYVSRFPELLIFIADVYRNRQIALEQGVDLGTSRDMDRFFQGFTDACLAAQNITVAIESMGMGAVFLGSILNDAAKIIEILRLPELTFPVLGVGFGVPAQNPQIKPRMDMSLKVFENAYGTFDSYTEAIADYDREMREYYDLRESGRRSDDFSKQVVKRLQSPIAGRYLMLNAVKAQGFDLGIEVLGRTDR